jgi:hypothetical protein
VCPTENRQPLLREMLELGDRSGAALWPSGDARGGAAAALEGACPLPGTRIDRQRCGRIGGRACLFYMLTKRHHGSVGSLDDGRTMGALKEEGKAGEIADGDPHHGFSFQLIVGEIGRRVLSHPCGFPLDSRQSWPLPPSG